MVFNKAKRRAKTLPREVREEMDNPEFQRQVREMMLESQREHWKRNAEKSEKNTGKLAE